MRGWSELCHRVATRCDWCRAIRQSNNQRGVWRLSPTVDLCGICVEKALAQLALEAGAPAGSR